MIQSHDEPERKDISEEGEFEENETYGNPLSEDGGEGLYGRGKLI
jgi:hypothetical protein